jgi:hypothetical protein
MTDVAADRVSPVRAIDEHAVRNRGERNDDRGNSVTPAKGRIARQRIVPMAASRRPDPDLP